MSTPYCRWYRFLSTGSFRLYLLVCFAFIVPGSRNAGAQTQPAGTTAAVSPPASDKNAAEMTSRETPATFKARVNLVLVPVVVRDGKGLAVGNLQKEDFQLFDKGKVQVISRFSVEKAGGTASGNEKSNEKSPDTNAPPKPDGEAAPLTIPTATSPIFLTTFTWSSGICRVSVTLPTAISPRSNLRRVPPSLPRRAKPRWILRTIAPSCMKPSFACSRGRSPGAGELTARMSPTTWRT